VPTNSPNAGGPTCLPHDPEQAGRRAARRDLVPEILRDRRRNAGQDDIKASYCLILSP
jgi:hypothetical protein